MKRIYPVRNKSPRAAAAVPVAGRISNGIYLDYAASTPVAPEVASAMRPYFSRRFGNPGSLHFFGQEAVGAIDKAREIIAKAIGAKFNEIIFTGSATEANNLVLRGAVKGIKNYELGIRNKELTKRPIIHNSNFIIPRIIVSAIEHESVLETARDLEREGAEVIYLPVSPDGLVNLKTLKKSLNARTILVSIMYANNETGVIQPISEIAQIIRNFREESGIKNNGSKNGNSKFIIHNSLFPLFHTDAVQAFQFLDCDINKLRVDLMTLSAHKIYGPKGVGVLYVRSLNPNPYALNPNPYALNPNPYALNPTITGGGQEFGLRSGTENVAAIVGFRKAVELVSNSRELENKRIRELRDYFWQELKKIYPRAQINADFTAFLPNILNVYFPNHSSEEMLIKLDMAGIAVSSGSACSARATKLSHVLKAIGLPAERIKSSLRFSLGRFTTKKEVDETIGCLKKTFSSSSPSLPKM